MVFKRIKFFSLLALLTYTSLAWSAENPASATPVEADIPQFMEKLAQKGRTNKPQSNPVKKTVKLPSPPCAAPTPISQADLPFTTPTSGNYCVVEDLTFSGGAAITVTEDNVCIDFDCHSLTLDPINTQGIVAANVFDLSVKNGMIKASAVSSDIGSIGISLVTVDGATIDHMVFRDTRRGILAGSGTLVGSCSNVAVTNCEFSHPAAAVGRGLSTAFIRGLNVENCVFTQIGAFMILLVNDDRDIRINNCHFDNVTSNDDIRWQGLDTFSSNLQVTNCTFNHYRRGLEVINFSTNSMNTMNNLIVQNCEFNNGTSVGIFLAGIDNTIIENCTITADPSNTANNLQMGSSSSPLPTNNIIVRNCILSNREAQPDFDNCLAFMNTVSGVLFENCIFDSNPSGEGLSFKTGNLVLGASISFNVGTAHDVKILDCIFTNTPLLHISAEAGSSNIVIEGCSFDGATEANILFRGCSDNVIKNCSITSSLGNGIEITDGVFDETQFFSQNNLIFQNNVQNNEKTGIVLRNNSSKNIIKENVSSNNGIDGIFLDSISCKNKVVANNVFDNAHDGINNQDCKCNEFFDNSACDNEHKNYSHVNTVVAVGEHTRTGGNLVCCKKKH